MNVGFNQSNTRLDVQQGLGLCRPSSDLALEWLRMASHIGQSVSDQSYGHGEGATRYDDKYSRNRTCGDVVFWGNFDAIDDGL